MRAIWRRLFIGGLVALAVAAGGLGPAIAGPYEDGFAAAERGDYATALRLFRPLAEQGDSNAQFSLGIMYAEGLGVAKNDAEAMKWWRLAAEQGYVDAQQGMGVLYDRDQGVPQNHAEAVKWWRLAAEQGDAYGQFSLGFMYAEGLGVAKNFVLAHMWFNLAAGQGDAEAMKERDAVAKKMTPQQRVEAQKLAANWKPKTWDELKRQMPK